MVPGIISFLKVVEPLENVKIIRHLAREGKRRRYAGLFVTVAAPPKGQETLSGLHLRGWSGDG